jgi:hypothetical protein
MDVAPDYRRLDLLLRVPPPLELLEVLPRCSPLEPLPLVPRLARLRERVKAGLAHERSKGQKLGRPKVRRDRDKDSKIIRQMRAEGDSYAEIADALGRSKADVYRVCMTLGCMEGGSTSPMSC